MLVMSIPASAICFPFSLRLLIERLVFGSFPEGVLRTLGSGVNEGLDSGERLSVFGFGLAVDSLRSDCPANGMILTGSVRNFFFLAPD